MMLKEEALWISNVLAQEALTSKTLILDVGSCTEEYRCLDQPFIDYYVFKPLRERGCQIVYTDLQSANGVNLVYDFASAVGDALILSSYWGQCDVVICANLLEHVEDRDLVVQRLKMLLKRGGLLILTAPNCYGYHPHPIDTMYRPTHKDLERLFDSNEYLVLTSNIIEDPSHTIMPSLTLLQRLHRGLIRRIARMIARTADAMETSVSKNKVAVIAVRRLDVIE